MGRYRRKLKTKFGDSLEFQQELSTEKVGFPDDDQLFVLDADGVSETRLSKTARGLVSSKANDLKSIDERKHERLKHIKAGLGFSKLPRNTKRIIAGYESKLQTSTHKKKSILENSMPVDIWEDQAGISARVADASRGIQKCSKKTRTLKGKFDRFRPAIPALMLPHPGTSFNPSDKAYENALLKAAVESVDEQLIHKKEDACTVINVVDDPLQVNKANPSQERYKPKAFKKKTRAERNRRARARAVEQKLKKKMQRKEMNKSIDRVGEIIKQVENDTTRAVLRQKSKDIVKSSLFSSIQSGNIRLKIGRNRYIRPPLEIPSERNLKGFLRTVDSRGASSASLDFISSFHRRGMIELPSTKLGTQHYLRNVKKLQKRRELSRKRVNK